MKAIVKLVSYIFLFVIGYVLILFVLGISIDQLVHFEKISLLKKTIHDIFVVLLVFSILYFVRIKIEKKTWGDYGLKKEKFLKLFILGLISGILLILFYKGFLILFGIATFNKKSLVLFCSIKNINFLIRVLLFSFIGTFFEELVFRGLFYDILKERLKIWQVILISSAVFAGLHFINSYFLFIGLFLSGIVLAYSRYFFNSIEFPWGLHFGWILYLQYFNGLGLVELKAGMPLWLVGYNYDPASGIIGVCILSILIPGIKFFSRFQRK